MKNHLKTITFSFFIVYILSACSGVEPSYQISSVNLNSSYATINEENLAPNNDIVTFIKGFCIQKDTCPNVIEVPTLKTSMAKSLYTLTPYGLMTLPFADFQGRNIKVPVGDIGIVLNHKYKKILNKEKIISVKKEYKFVTFSWPCLNEVWINRKQEMSSNPTFWSKNATLLTEFINGNSGDIYIVNYEQTEWDSVMWVKLDSDIEYIFNLSEGRITGKNGKIIASDNIKIPSSNEISTASEIITENTLFLGNKLGEKYEVDQNCMFTIKNNGEDFLGSILSE